MSEVNLSVGSAAAFLVIKESLAFDVLSSSVSSIKLFLSLVLLRQPLPHAKLITSKRWVVWVVLTPRPFIHLSLAVFQLV